MHTQDAVVSDCPHTPDEDDHYYWLALWHTPGVGAVSYLQLLTALGSPRAALHASDQQLIEQGVTASFIEARRHTDWQAADADMRWLRGDGQRHLLTCHDADYPPLLKEIAAPPPLLYVLGERACLTDPQLAIVGSRNPSASGEQHAEEFAAALSSLGLTITSGLALGIDAWAHHAALQAGGRTIAVVGNGLNSVYPARHRQLAERIAMNGAIISEFSPDTTPLRQNFPRRNRIISGLAVGVLVIEAAARSGSLITARLAAEQGREVFALPGSIHNPLSRGCHELIRQGAKLVETTRHIVEELGPLLAGAAQEPQNSRQAIELSKEEQHLLDNMGFEICPVDSLIRRSGLTPEAVSSMLLTLELRGIVDSLPGGNVSRRH